MRSASGAKRACDADLNPRAQVTADPTSSSSAAYPGELSRANSFGLEGRWLNRRVRRPKGWAQADAGTRPQLQRGPPARGRRGACPLGQPAPPGRPRIGRARRARRGAHDGQTRRGRGGNANAGLMLRLFVVCDLAERLRSRSRAADTMLASARLGSAAGLRPRGRRSSCRARADP